MRLSRRGLLGMLAAPAIITRGHAAWPGSGRVYPQGVNLSVPLLSQLSGGTTIIGAWSTARQLLGSAANAFLANKIGISTQNIGFVGGKLDTTSLTTFAASGSVGVSYVYDQSGNANYLTRPSTSSYCPITTPAGALNAAIACAGGFSAPMLSLGYNGLSAGTTGPYLASGTTTTPGNMAVSFGAASAWWCFTVTRMKSGSGNAAGSITNFIHTGDSNGNSDAGSCVMLARDNSTTSGLMYCIHANVGFATATAPNSTPTLLGSVFNGTNAAVYVDRTPGTTAAYSGALGSGGSFGLGDWANAGAFGTVPFAGDVVEVVTGTALAAADLTLIQANMRAFYGTA